MLRRYGLYGFLKLSQYYILTKLSFKNSRLIRFPIDVRNKKFIDFGYGLTTGRYCRIECFPDKFEVKKKCICFGNNVEINDFVHIAAKQSIIIGNNVLIASKVFISDLNHGQYSSNSQSDPRTHPNDRPIVSKPIVIEDDVWIGESACVMPGVRIGRGSIIGALAVVTKDIPEYSIAAGNPARVIKKYNFSLNCWERFIS